MKSIEDETPLRLDYAVRRRVRQLHRQLKPGFPNTKVKKKLLPEKIKSCMLIRIPTVCYNPASADLISECSHSCIYCFARVNQQEVMRVRYDNWNPELYRIADFDIIKKAFKDSEQDYPKGISLYIKRRIPLRLSVWSDPLQPCEKDLGIYYKMFKLIDDYDYPIIISTKGKLALDRKYFKLLTNLKYLIMQVSIPTSSKKVAKQIEPFAPSPSFRMKILKEYSECGIRTVGRIFPIIPLVTDYNVNRTIEKVATKGHADLLHFEYFWMSSNATQQKLLRERTGKNVPRYMKSGGYTAQGIYYMNKYDTVRILYPALQKCKEVGIDYVIDNNSLFQFSSTLDRCCGAGELPIGNKRELSNKGWGEMNQICHRSWINMLAHDGRLDYNKAFSVQKPLTPRHLEDAEKVFAQLNHQDFSCSVEEVGRDKLRRPIYEMKHLEPIDLLGEMFLR